MTPLAARIAARRTVSPSPIRPTCAFCGSPTAPAPPTTRLMPLQPLAAKRAAAA
jgi:hypothetical protein